MQRIHDAPCSGIAVTSRRGRAKRSAKTGAISSRPCYYCFPHSVIGTARQGQFSMRLAQSPPAAVMPHGHRAFRWRLQEFADHCGWGSWSRLQLCSSNHYMEQGSKYSTC